MNTLISSILVNIYRGLLHWPSLVDWLDSGNKQDPIYERQAQLYSFIVCINK